jgi:hypothetical protein
MRRPIGAGRRAGTPNKSTQDLRSKLACLHCDPITALVTLANAPETPLELRTKILVELASYVYPKPTRSVALSEPVAAPVIIEIVKVDPPNPDLEPAPQLPPASSGVSQSTAEAAGGATRFKFPQPKYNRVSGGAFA